MTAGNKKPEEKSLDALHIVRSLREVAEEQLARFPKRFPDLTEHSAEVLIHELQVHQIELETQAEELRRVQSALEKSRDKYLDLFDFAPVGYLMLSDKALIEDQNLKAATLLGLEQSTLANTRFRKFIAPEDLDKWDRYFINVLNNGEVQFCTLILKRADKTTFPARLDSIRISDNRKENPMVRVAINDITYIRKAEMALSISNKKLTLLSSITRHDINNQLLSLNGFLELLHKKVPDPALEHFFDRITNASSQISAMIRFTKEYEQIGVRVPIWQDCRTLIDKATKEVPLGQIIVKNDLPAGTEVFADPLILKVFYNLIDNAVRYGGKITTIRFSVEKHDHVQIIVCEDDGNGVLAEEKERIFDRGFGKNTGLGLALAREILDITGITIHETGEPGKGARFEIIIPEGVFR
jgi:PAS domain S-box-containing protein